MATRRSLQSSAPPAHRAAGSSARSGRPERRLRGARDHARPELRGRAGARGAAGVEVVEVDLDDRGERRRGVRGRLRRVLRHVLLGRTSRPRPRCAQATNDGERREDRRRASRRSGRRSRTRARRAARRRPHADAARQVQGAALRRQGAKPTPRLHDAGVPTTFLRTAFYWENFIYFGARPGSAARTACSRSRCRWATASCRRWRRRTSARSPTASSRAATS